MIYTPLTRRAMALCFEKHKEQVDKSGVPYPFHPFHVAQAMTDEASTCAALLHDILEDTDMTAEELRAAGFPEEVLRALRLLCRDKAVPYLDYVHAVKDDPIARQVKLADLAHNADLTRLESITDADRARAEKYHAAMALLQT